MCRRLFLKILLNGGSTDLLLRVPQVEMEANAELERPLSVHELYSAVQGMANGLAPGIDGIPIDFYKSFWSAIGANLLAVPNESLAEGQLPLNCRMAVFTVLPKRESKKGCRPVAVLCVDSNVLSKAKKRHILAPRMWCLCPPDKVIQSTICRSVQDIISIPLVCLHITEELHQDHISMQMS